MLFGTECLYCTCSRASSKTCCDHPASSLCSTGLWVWVGSWYGMVWACLVAKLISFLSTLLRYMRYDSGVTKLHNFSFMLPALCQKRAGPLAGSQGKLFLFASSPFSGPVNSLLVTSGCFCYFGSIGNL